MQRGILLGIVVSFILAIPVTHAAENFFLKDVRFGSRGIEVNKLQEFLTDEKLYTGPISGNFFSLTLRAVKKFQKREKLAQTGQWSKKTRARANQMIAAELGEEEEPDDPILTSKERTPLFPTPVPARVVPETFRTSTSRTIIVPKTSPVTSFPAQPTKRDTAPIPATPTPSINPAPTANPVPPSSGTSQSPAPTSAPVVPVISDITVTDITSSTVVVIWKSTQIIEGGRQSVVFWSTPNSIYSNSVRGVDAGTKNGIVTLNGLIPNTTYSFYVQYFEGQNSVSANSETKTFATAFWLPEPMNLRATNQNGFSINLAWSTPTVATGVTNYAIFRNAVQIALVDQNAYVDYNIRAGDAYTYEIKSSNGTNYSVPSNAVSVNAQFTDIKCNYESDGGLYHNVAGYVNTDQGTYQDTCLDKNIYGASVNLREAYCDGDSSRPAAERNFKISDVDCAYGCAAGACNMTPKSSAVPPKKGIAGFFQRLSHLVYTIITLPSKAVGL